MTAEHQDRVANGKEHIDRPAEAILEIMGQRCAEHPVTATGPVENPKLVPSPDGKAQGLVWMEKFCWLPTEKSWSLQIQCGSQSAAV